MSARNVSARKLVAKVPSSDDDALSYAAALVAYPVILGVVGSLVDRAVGTGPILLLAFAAFGAIASFVSAYYRYEARMARHDAGKPWARRWTPNWEPERGRV